MTDAKNILVTGGARGIGRGIVFALAEAGHHVAFCGRAGAEMAADMLNELKTAYPCSKFTYYSCDISSETAQNDLLESFVRDFGTPDVLVNNAGVAPEVRADLLEMSAESFQRVLKINLEGPFFLTQKAARLMIAEKRDSFRCIINIGSVSADYASINRGEYCISKSAVAMATKLWAVRLADEGIAVYELRPGVIMSDMTGPVKEKYDRMIAEGLTLQKRWGQPQDVGMAVASLVSGAFAYSTGQVINIDGGLTIERF